LVGWTIKEEIYTRKKVAVASCKHKNRISADGGWSGFPVAG